MSELIDRGDVLGVISCFFEDSFIEDADVHCAELEWEINRLPAAPRWVRCEDEKPKERDYYFAFTADAEAFVGEYIPSVEQWWNGDDLILTVTHWMPIEPPQEVQDGQ